MHACLAELSRRRIGLIPLTHPVGSGRRRRVVPKHEIWDSYTDWGICFTGCIYLVTGHMVDMRVD